MQPTTSTVEVTSAASMEHEVRNELNTSSPMTLPDLISKLETAEGGSRELDADTVRRLTRYVEGETVSTVYRLPPNGRHDPLRRDIAALLRALQSQDTPHEG